MRGSLFSPVWYRVAGQQPCLRGDIRVQRQRSRDQNWYVLLNSATGRPCRISAAAYQVLGRCNGASSLAQIWDSLVEELQNEAPTQDEVIAILSQLDHQALLSYEGVPDVEVLMRNHDERERQR